MWELRLRQAFSLIYVGASFLTPAEAEVDLGSGMKPLRLHFCFSLVPVISVFVFRFIPICLLIFFSSLVLQADELMEYLKQYEGRWVGEFTIYSAATGYSQTFPVEQRYWWEDGQLHGISVSDTNSGMQVARSRTFIKDDTLHSEITQGEVKESFYGVLHDGGVVWLPTDLNRATDYQMKEALVEEGTERQLHTDGFDSYVYKEGLTHLVYRGRLIFAPEEAK